VLRELEISRATKVVPEGHIYSGGLCSHPPSAAKPQSHLV